MFFCGFFEGDRDCHVGPDGPPRNDGVGCFVMASAAKQSQLGFSWIPSSEGTTEVESLGINALLAIRLLFLCHSPEKGNPGWLGLTPSAYSGA